MEASNLFKTVFADPCQGGVVSIKVYAADDGSVRPLHFDLLRALKSELH